MTIDIQTIKQLREETGAGVLEVKETLAKFNDDYTKAKEELMKRAYAKAEKKADRVAQDGLVHAYIHSNGKIGSLIVMACETDFVAKTDDFLKLCHEVAMQAATEDYASVEALLNSEYIRDTSKKISDLIKETVAKVGENIELKKVVRLSVRE